MIVATVAGPTSRIMLPGGTAPIDTVCVRTPGSVPTRPRRPRAAARHSPQPSLAPGCRVPSHAGPTSCRDSPNIITLRSEEGVGHRAADHQHLDPPDEVAEQTRAWWKPWRPPTIAATGRTGWPSAALQCLQFRLHQPPSVGGQQVRHALGAGVGAVRGGESVIDVDIGQLRRDRAANSGSFFSSPAWKRVFSSTSTSPRAMRADRLLRRRADAVLDEAHLTAQHLAQRHAPSARATSPAPACPSGGRNGCTR